MRVAILLSSVSCLVIGPACVGAPPPPPGQESESASEATSAHDGVTAATMADSVGASTGSTSGFDHGSTATAGVGEPLLEFADAASYDFGLVAVGGRASHVFTITNEGTGPANGITGQSLVPPFTYAGEFPGARGTCSSTLAAGESCTVDVLFSPLDLGPFEDTLAIAYDEGAEATNPVMGAGSGATDNLLTNPGGESPGGLPGWTDVGEGVWDNECGGNPPYSGSNCIASANGPDMMTFVLQQDVTVSQWSTLVDQGLLVVSFEGYARVENPAAEYGVHVYFHDARGQFVDDWEVGPTSSATWDLVSNQWSVLDGTRVVRVELTCRKTSGTYCGAYFDDLQLHVSYP